MLSRRAQDLPEGEAAGTACGNAETQKSLAASEHTQRDLSSAPLPDVSINPNHRACSS